MSAGHPSPRVVDHFGISTAKHPVKMRFIEGALSWITEKGFKNHLDGIQEAFKDLLTTEWERRKMKTTHRRKASRHSNLRTRKTMTDQEPLSVELAWFEANRLALFEKQPGRWAAVKGEVLLGVYDDFSTAFNEGSKLANSTQILVKQILLKDITFSAPALTLGLIGARL